MDRVQEYVLGVLRAIRVFSCCFLSENMGPYSDAPFSKKGLGFVKKG